jgi:beta-exotoxin I transport system ATP-binding protein
MLETRSRTSGTEGTDSAIVHFDAVTKIYRGGGGVRNLTLDVEPGEIFGYLGPNGAGKTTTIRLLLDLIRPSAGTISVFGHDSRRDSVAIRRRVGYLPGDLALYEQLSARDVLSHFSHLRGGPAWKEIRSLADSLELDLDRPIRSLSRGTRQKVGIVAALMGEPDLLVLDEPTSGLDPLVQHQVHEMLRAAAASGRSVFLSSHVLSEVAQIADRVGLIRDGELVTVERVVDLRERAAHLIDVRLHHEANRDTFASLPGVTVCTVSGNDVHLEVAGDLRPVVSAIAASDLDDLSIREPSLEEVFLAFYDNVP